MQFTYRAYENMLYLLQDRGYSFSDYNNCCMKNRTVILRHDVDYSIEKAVILAKLEYDIGVNSTYFVMITSPLYNLMAKEILSELINIKKMGHSIGLHFDELNYDKEDYDNYGGIKNIIFKEIELIKSITGIDITFVSMHRPSKETLEANFDLSPLVNAYGKYFFKEFKYVSDSRRKWREDIDNIINDGVYDKLHILTHPFWYNYEEKDLKSSLTEFINRGNLDRFNVLNNNITNLSEIVSCNDNKSGLETEKNVEMEL